MTLRNNQKHNRIMAGIFSMLGVLFLSVIMPGCGRAENVSSDNLSNVNAETSVPAEQQSAAQGTLKIKLTFQGETVAAELLDNPTSRDFAANLPMTLEFKDFNETEKIADPPKTLSTENAPAGYEPKPGDLAVFAPWGNISIFYKDFRYSEGLIPFGHITSGLDALSRIQDGTTIRIEKME